MARYMKHAGTSCCAECRPSVCDPCEQQASCCPYPYDAYRRGDFPKSDLPAKLYVSRAYGDLQGMVFTRNDDSNSEQVYAGDRIGDDQYTISDLGTGAYVLTTGSGYHQTFFFCLIGDYYAGEGAALSDYFEDTYVVSFSGKPSVTVTRHDLCTWKGGGITLRYESGYTTNPTDPTTGPWKWQVNGHSKSGSQNDPTGLYEGGYSVS